jgi:hypothetical protein
VSTSEPRRRWWDWKTGMPEWVLREHVWWLRAQMAAGFPIMGWGAYVERASVVFAGITATTVGLLFWRMSGRTDLGLSPDKGLNLTTDIPPLRAEKPTPTSEPAAPSPPDSLQRPT